MSRALRKADIRTNVLPYPTPSGISEQPRTIDETYRGAENRHAQLRKEVHKDSSATYLATVESGWAQIHEKHNHFGCIVVILEEVGVKQKSTVYLELELPKEMTDKVPNIYPDLGVLVQEEYGARLKDPIPYQSNGMMTRLQLTESAVYTVAAHFAKNPKYL